MALTLMQYLKQLKTFFKPQNVIALLALLLCLGLGSWLVQQDVSQRSPSDLLQHIHSLGAVGVLLFIGISALAIVVSPIPGTPLTVAAGAVWGPVLAGIYASTGIFIGCLVAYFVGRTLGRSAVRALTGKTIYLSNHRGELYLALVMFFSHLFPILPCDLMSYGAGVSGLSFPIYAVSTLLGTIPGTFFLAYVGSTFRVGLETGLLILLVVVVLLVVLPWGVSRYNWLGLRDVVRLE